MKDNTTNEIIKFPLTIKCNQSSVKRCQNPCLKGRRWDEGAFHLGTRRDPPGDTTHALERRESRGASHPPWKRWQPSKVCHCLLAMPGESGWYLLWLGHIGANLTILRCLHHPPVVNHTLYTLREYCHCMCIFFFFFFKRAPKGSHIRNSSKTYQHFLLNI